MAALERAGVGDADPASRGHATPFIYHHPDRFALAGVRNAEDLSRHRWTLDTPEDYELLSRISAGSGTSTQGGARSWPSWRPIRTGRT